MVQEVCDTQLTLSERLTVYLSVRLCPHESFVEVLDTHLIVLQKSLTDANVVVTCKNAVFLSLFHVFLMEQERFLEHTDFVIGDSQSVQCESTADGVI